MDYHIFFTEAERENVCMWEQKVDDRSLTNRILRPVWKKLVTYVPENVAPNVISLCGLLMLVEAWYIVSAHMGANSRVAIGLSIALFAGFYACDALDGIHAKRIMNDSPVGELFDLMCSNIGTIFMVLCVCEIFGLDSVCQWNLVQAGELVLLRKHLTGFKTGVMTYKMFAGPGECLVGIMCLLMFRAVFGLTWFVNAWTLIVPHISFLVGHVSVDVTNSHEVVVVSTSLIFYTMAALTVYEAIRLSKANRATRNGILIVLCWRILPTLLLEITPSTWTEDTTLSTVGDGLLLSIVTSDIAAAKMAKRDLHPLIVVFALACPLNALAPLVVIPLYYISVFHSLCSYTHLPLFTVNRNVYCDGVYDLCHLGHMNLFREAASFGTRLVVGVCGDEDCSIYKRPPIMRTHERVNTVKACKCVNVVIPNAPTFGLTEEFLRKHRIHVVAHSAEYDKADDKYYAVPRKLGMTRVLPRTEGVSTSELISRIVNAHAEGTIGSPRLKPLEVKSFVKNSKENGNKSNGRKSNKKKVV